LTTLQILKTEFEERFHQKWTSLSVQYHFKAIASKLVSIPFNEVIFNLSTEVEESQLALFKTYIVRLEANEPLQHIIEETEFMGFPIICSPSALIPRPETEELVELIVLKAKGFLGNLKILDLCTGTGCIAIALQKLIKEAEVQAIDNFDNTIALARQNCDLNEVSINISKVDVLSIDEMNEFGDNRYDIWVSNPPYIPNSDKMKMETNVLDFEPHEALFVSDDDPLVFYKAISKAAQKSLKNEGWLFFEIHEDFGEEMIALLKENNFKNISIIADMQGKNRIAFGQK
jgi:release factor glutamine methyltransferase|tara:strand:- start:3900 stop:4763 length:864 start_codon:yes stop_codon:yes gene_type:complete